MGVSTRRKDYKDTTDSTPMGRNTPSTVAAPHNASILIFQPIAHPVLRTVDPVKVAKFMKDRELYEMEIDEKAKEVPTLTKASYAVSVDRGLLKNMVYMGRFDAIAPLTPAEQLTDEQIKQFIENIVAKQSVGFDPKVVDQALSGLSMLNSIADPEARVLHLAHSMFERLESIGYGEFRDPNPKKTVQLLCERLQPQQLRTVMCRKIDYDEALQKDVKGFINLTCREAIACQSYAAIKPRDAQSSGPRSTSRSNSSSTPNSTPSTAHDTTSRGRRVPICLWPPHKSKKIRHFTRDCSECPPEEKQKFLKERRDVLSAERENKGGARRLAVAPTAKKSNVTHPQDDEKACSVMFSATFASRVRDILCADIGSDINLMDAILLRRVQDSGAAVSFNELSPPHRYAMAAKSLETGQDAYVKCTHTATLDVDLHVRHGTTLILRNLKWLITEQRVREPLLGRPTLEALGLNTENILAAAADKHGGEIDATMFSDTHVGAGGRVARTMSDGVIHSDGGADDQGDEDLDWCDFGDDDPCEKAAALERLIHDAKDRGISPDGECELRAILREYDDTFRLRLGACPPARVEPLVLEVNPSIRPIKVGARRYPEAKRRFLERATDKLLKLGLPEPCHDAKWVAAPLIAPKKPPAMFRFTVDLRPINAATAPMPWPMPHLDSEVCDMRGSKFFASLDFPSGFWQLPMHEDSRSFHAFMTPRGVLRPTRTLQGGNNSATNFQAKVEPLFAHLRPNLKAWIDDIAIHASDEAKLLSTLRAACATCRDHGLFLSAMKCSLFSRTLHWCGRIIDEHGVKLDPSKLGAMQNAETPRSAAELCQYVHCMAWMSNGIPNFADRAAPLRAVLERAHERSGKRTKKSISRMLLRDLGWTREHDACFADLQGQICDNVKLAHRDPKLSLCVYTDASDAHWAGVATQCEPSELAKPTESQRHWPLAFLSGDFKGAAEGWTTYEKEAFAIYETFRRLDYLLLCEQNTRVFTDHKNLPFVFDPRALDPTLARHKILKVMRWALYLSQYGYTIEHVAGTRNVAAYIMTRWMRGFRGHSRTIKRVSHLPIEKDIVPSPTDDGFEWPRDADIAAAQRESTASRPANAVAEPGGILAVNNRVWIPNEAEQLQLRLLVVAHCGTAGHRGAKSTAHALRERFTWSTLDVDAAALVANCIHCLMAKSGHKIPRPLSTTLHATLPNQVIHFDFLYMGPGVDKAKYILVVKDDISSYTWLHVARHADSETCAAALARWIRTFGAMTDWVSDQGTHFKNKVTATLADAYRISHTFTVAYSPWVNGTVEAVMRTVQAACRALLTDLKLGPHDWPTIAPVIQSILNEAPLERLGIRDDGVHRPSLEVMTGLRPRRDILYHAIARPGDAEHMRLERIRAIQLINIRELQSALDKMHKSAHTAISKNRLRQIRHHNKQTSIVTPNFTIGDFVLVRSQQKKGHKMQFRWIGPRRIISAVSNLVYDVAKLDGNDMERVHCARMCLYKARKENAPVAAALLKLANHTEARYELVESIKDIGEAEDGIHVQVEWAGLPEKCDWTWVPLHNLYEDMPIALTEIIAKAKRALHLS